MESICKINIVCSYIGYLILNGNVEAIKFLYGTAWREHPALIKTIDHLQGYLTSVLGNDLPRRTFITYRQKLRNRQNVFSEN